MSGHRQAETQTCLCCPACGRRLALADHAALVCDAGRVWCLDCRRYPSELTASRELAELQGWVRALCPAFGQEPVHLLEDPEARSDWRRYWRDDVCLLAEAYHDHRAILLYPPGQRLTTLCHELAHIFTREDHTIAWALTFARLVAWVQRQLPA